MNSEFALALHLVLIMTYFPETLFTSKRLSELLGVHSARIRKILSLLRQNNLVNSKEGVSGGFTVCFDPAAVTLNDIYQITQRNVLEPKCHDCTGGCQIGKNIKAVLNGIFSEVDSDVQKRLSEYTIERVMNMTS